MKSKKQVLLHKCVSFYIVILTTITFYLVEFWLIYNIVGKVQ